MRIIRAILLAIFTLLFVLFASGMVRSVDPGQSNLPALAFFALVIAVLGPLWPSKEKVENSKLRLPTDDPKVAYPLFMAGMSLLSFFFAIDAWVSPQPAHGKLAKTVYSLFGNDGVVVFWALLGLLGAVGAFHGYKKYKSA